VTLARIESGRTETPAKASAAVTCLGALALIVGLTGCAGDRYTQITDHSFKENGTAEPDHRQTTDQSAEGKRTAERVREALAAAPESEFGGVHVAAGKGVVQLSGVVNTSAQRNLAGELASKVAGVKIVLNSLTVMN
jgi:osmotically-inducible protein OsmY